MKATARLLNTIYLRPGRSLRYFIGLLAFAAGVLVRVPLSSVLGSNVPYIFFFPVVALSAWFGGLGPGLLTTALSAIAVAYSLISQNSAAGQRTILTTALFLLTASFISWLNDAFRKSEHRLRDELLAREKAEEALRKSDERLNLALDAGGGVGTWDWDIPKQHICADLRFAELFSMDPHLLAKGVPVEALANRLHPDDRHRIAEASRDALTKGGNFTVEYRLTQEDGSVRWVYARGHCQCDSNGRPFRLPGIALDITARKETETELRRANRELEEFAYVVSHDLQEPLRMVNIYTQALVRKLSGKLDGDAEEYAALIQGGAERMQLLVKGLLESLNTMHVENDRTNGEANLELAFSNALQMLQRRVEETGAAVHAEPLPTLRGNEAQLTQLFQNLLSNALKYQKSGQPPTIQIKAEQKVGEWQISVQDNGIGFESKHAERIFGLFKRLHRDEYPGTGLGLAICQRIAERHGGRIWAESRGEGQGATFFITLPAAPPEGVGAYPLSAQLGD